MNTDTRTIKFGNHEIVLKRAPVERTTTSYRLSGSTRKAVKWIADSQGLDHHEVIEFGVRLAALVLNYNIQETFDVLRTSRNGPKPGSRQRLNPARDRRFKRAGRISAQVKKRGRKTI